MPTVSRVMATAVAEALVGRLRCDIPTFSYRNGGQFDKMRPDMLDERAAGGLQSHGAWA